MEKYEPLFFHEFLKKSKPLLILDLGCGEGSFNYSAYNHTVIAIDNKIPNFTGEYFLMADADSIPLRDGIADIVIANWLLEHVSNPATVLGEIERVMSSGGLFYASIPNSFGLEDRLYRLFNKDSGGHIQKYNFESFLNLVYSTTGFKLVSFCEWPAGYTWMKTHIKKKFQKPWLKMLQIIKRYFNKDIKRKNNWIFLFRLEGNRGLRVVSHVCRKCGSGVLLDSNSKLCDWIHEIWRCPSCETLNYC